MHPHYIYIIMWKYIVLFFILFFSSCSKNKTASNDGSIMLHVPTETNENYFRDHFELESIVPIETANSFLISSIDKVIKIKDDVLLLSKDDKTVSLINARSGQLKTYIHRVGNGPGESNRIIDVAFDEVLDHILIYNDYKKLLTFDLQGNFLSDDVQADAIYENMIYNNGEVIFYNKLKGYTCYPYAFKIYNLKDKEWKISGSDKKIDFPIRSLGKQIVKSKRVWVNAPLDCKLYCLERNELVPYYHLDIPIFELSDDLIERAKSNPMELMTRISKDNIVYSVNSVRETDNHLIFHTNQNDFLLLDKNKNELHINNFMFQDIFYLTPNDYFPHDGDDNSILFIIPAERWIKEPELMSGIPTEWRKKVETFNISEDDNSILLFFKEK